MSLDDLGNKQSYLQASDYRFFYNIQKSWQIICIVQLLDTLCTLLLYSLTISRNSSHHLRFA